jgi:hypothetical protein
VQVRGELLIGPGGVALQPIEQAQVDGIERKMFHRKMMNGIKFHFKQPSK